MKLWLDVWMGFSNWSVVFCVTTSVEMNDVVDAVVWLDEDFWEQRLDVCPVPHGVCGSENESDDGSDVVVVELRQVEEDGSEEVEQLDLVMELEQEVGSRCALGSCPQTPSYWTPLCPSSVASSLQH